MKDKIKEILKQKYSDKVIMLLKFTSREEFAQDVLDGKLYMNTAEFYREYEEKHNIKGIGDKNELKLEISPITLTLNISGKELKLKPTGKAVFEYKDDKNMPMYCMTYLTIDDFEIINYDENSVTLGLNLDIDLLKKDFGEYVTIIINADEFKERIFIKQKEYDVDTTFGLVKYREKFDKNRTEEFLSASIERFLYKDKDYEYQKECRIIISRYVDDDKYFRVDDLRDIALNCKTSELKEKLIIECKYINRI
ncbi:hypothetical protein ACV3Z6_13575 [Clostridium perfringens]|uniref:hypothetical protein n=1 Tax=Clostridium perfringens TaxID=1502 RepID=UPI001A1EC8AB|nr:hypothetical protein [Clostridium perfringens]MDN4557947.1 hypothetical protein [Clostridium perfringens]MDT7988284.1 hypothetical protein [Clostridium perfringens]HAT4183907.1 hypothetical protein [Clostridium perfringens]